ncbi:MAG: TetR/AcrR family transcriptional regulator [Bacillus sp. (in: firmicutes)]
MTIEQIKKAALMHFAEKGFDGTSMAHIAAEVGIKKQSIYTHFSSKDNLFMEICREVFQKEAKSAIHYIEANSDKPIAEFLYYFLLDYKRRFEMNDHTKFWLHVSFFPPSHLHESIMEAVYSYLDQLQDLIVPIIENAMRKEEIDPSIGSSRAAAAFLGVLDGILVEMLYGGPERLTRRLEASWHVFWRGLSKV